MTTERLTDQQIDDGRFVTTGDVEKMIEKAKREVMDQVLDYLRQLHGGE
jgi:hypothetical protein